jgi:glutamate formiminotransferase/formiminotetrahydrofolate cyclodeaminase
VKALGLEVDGQAQVSMNLVDTERTPLAVAFDAVSAEAQARGATPTHSELIGLVPEKVLFDMAVHHVRLVGFTPSMVLEREVRAATQGSTLAGFVSDVAGSDPVPGGGSVSALAGQLAAALARMVAGLTIGRAKYADVEDEMRALAIDADALVARLGALVREDADAYALVSRAYRLPKDDPGRAAAVEQALLAAARVPLETARACRDAARLAVTCAERGNTNTVTDAGVAALLAEAGCRGAGYNVRINVVALRDHSAGAPLAADAQALVVETAAFAAETTARVEAALS